VLPRKEDRRGPGGAGQKGKKAEGAGPEVALLASYWSGRSAAEVTEATCEGFAAHVGSPSYARRCLGDMQAALGEARRAGILRKVVTVTLPAAPAPREDWLSSPEAVALVRTCWTHRDTQLRQTRDGPRLVIGRKRPWAHLVRFTP